MSITVVGLNHRTAPIRLREKLAFPKSALVRALDNLKKVYGIHEAVVLSTCNRVEIYVSSPPDRSMDEELEAFLGSFHGLRREQFAASLYHFHEADAVRHLFKVSSSLDSMVIGESEIVGQVKDAYRIADTNGMCGKVFHRLFQKSLATSRRVRSDTGIARGSVSVSSIAVNLARKIFGNLWGKEVLLIGTGKMSAKTARLLKTGGVGRMMVMSHSAERARACAREFGGVAITDGTLLHAIERADIVIASSNAPQFIVRKNTLADILPSRGFRPLLFVDLGVPRNVDPEVGTIRNVNVYDIDNLAAISEENAQIRRSELQRGLQIVEEKADEVMGWLDVTCPPTKLAPSAVEERSPELVEGFDRAPAAV